MFNELRYSARTLRRSPLFVATASLALALGIGANVAVFSVVYAVLLKPLPYSEPERLVRLSERGPDGVDTGVVAAGTFEDWRTRSRTLESVAAYTEPRGGETLWALGNRYYGVRISRVSPSLFELLRVAPALGRAFRPEREQDRPSGDHGQFVLSYGVWQRLFGGAPDVVGRTISVEGRFPGQIVGVMPRGFAFPDGADAWGNLAFVSGVPDAHRRRESFRVIARLRAGATIDTLRAELRDMSVQLATEQPATNAGWTAHAVPLAGADTAGATPALLALLGAVAGVLLIGCASVANLLLARATARRHETAVRIALGARLSDLVRLCLADAIVLAACATVAGVGLGEGLVHVLVRLAPEDVPRLSEAGVNAPVLLFAAATGALTTVLIGLAPVLHGARTDRRGSVVWDSRAATAPSAHVRHWLIAGEVAIVVLLMTGAFLLVRTFVNLRGVDLGFRTERVLYVSTRWPIGKLFGPPPTSPDKTSRGAASFPPWRRIQAAVDDLVAAVGSVPGVEAAGLISEVPLTGDPFTGMVWRAEATGGSAVTPPADPRQRWKADMSIVTPGYFRAMAIPIVRGRNFSDFDRLTDEQLRDAAAPRNGVVIVNNAFAARYFPGQDALGRSLVLYDDQEFGPLRTIVGIAGDTRSRSVSELPSPAVFIPHTQHPDVFVPSLVVRSRLPADAIAPAIRRRIEAYDPQLLVQGIRPMADVVSGALARPRFNLVLLGSFAVVALLLSAVGISGVLSLLVSQRTREIGIRIALGATARHVARMVVSEGMVPVVFGVAAGMLGAVAATRVVRSMLFGVSALDPVSFVAAPAVLAAVALMACYIPARRATRLDPILALRTD